MSDDDGYFWEGKTEEELQAHIARKRAEADAALTAHLEQMAAAVPHHSWPPAPDTAHPSLARSADGIRAVMERGEHQVHYAVPRPLKVSDFDVDAPIGLTDTTRVLNVQRACGLAPWTGEPYVWEWRIALDGANRRWVAGEAYRRPLLGGSYIREET